MFRCEKIIRFEAAHELPYHDGHCRRLHGHSFVGTVICEAEDTCKLGAKQGMVIDFTDIKAVAQPIVDHYLDHHYLNETLAPEGVINPTSEEIARWLYNKLRPMLPTLVEVKVAETCTASASYRPTCNQPKSESNPMVNL